ncbi:hypothetical protein CGRA01v4_05189 [Colletotrichum graminicola]|nr:hypothetical protein CGRA01v4_05189 [Colletotrichum graminicola]
MRLLQTQPPILRRVRQSQNAPLLVALDGSTRFPWV